MTACRWLVGILLGCLAAVLIAPSTRWLVVAQIEQLIPFSQAQAIRLLPDPLEAREHALRAVVGNQSDYRRQLAAVCLGYQADERVDRLRQLINRFPDNPSLRATILRFRCLGQVLSTGRTEEALAFGFPDGKPGKKPSSDAIRDFEEDCRAGEELDADNAFFPFMRSVVQFADGRDNDALESINRAASKPDWREYIDDEPIGGMSLIDEMYGRQSAISRAAVLAAVLLPHYSAQRSAIRVAVAKAQQLESAGHSSEGIAIRHAIMTVGGLIRARGRTAIANVIGISFLHLATRLPGKSIPPKEERETTEQREKWRDAIYVEYLEKQGRADEAGWVRRQLEAAVQTRAILHPFPGDIIKMIVVLGMSWLGCLFLLSNALWLALAAGAANAASRFRSVRAGRPLRWPIMLAALTLFALAVLAGVLQAVRIAQTVHFMAALTGESEDTRSPFNPNLPGVAVTPVVLLLLGAIIAVLAIRWRVPLSVAMVRGFRALALPIAGVLFIGYIAMLIQTVNREHEVEYYNQRWIENEGRYAAELKNTAWIDVVK